MPAMARLDGLPGLNIPSVAEPVEGATFASKRKLYSVPQRMALALLLAANVSVVKVSAPPDTEDVHAALLYGSPECESGAWKPTLDTVTPAPAGTLNVPAERSEFRL